MKKNLFLAISLIWALASCQRLESVNPSDDNGSSSSSLSSSSSSSSSPGTVVPLSAVPQSVKNYITTHYAGFAIHEVQTEWEHGITYYKVNIRKGKDRKNLIFSNTWAFVREKK
jgi:hypothetical protein